MASWAPCTCRLSIDVESVWGHLSSASLAGSQPGCALEPVGYLCFPFASFNRDADGIVAGHDVLELSRGLCVPPMQPSMAHRWRKSAHATAHVHCIGSDPVPMAHNAGNWALRSDVCERELWRGGVTFLERHIAETPALPMCALTEAFPRHSNAILVHNERAYGLTGLKFDRRAINEHETTRDNTRQHERAREKRYGHSEETAAHGSTAHAC